MGPETLANNLVPCHVRDLEALCTGVMRALAPAGVLGQRGTGLADGPALETPHRDRGGGQATRQRRIADQGGRGQAIEVPVDGWHVRWWSAAATTSPLAVQVGQLPDHAARWTRALVPPPQAPLAGHARRPTVVLAQGCWAGPELGWLDQQGRTWVVPATDHLAVPAAARALAAAGEGVTNGHRVHTVRQGPGHRAWAERLETAGVGSTGRTTAEPSGTAAHGRPHQRRAFEANPIQAVVVRTWQGKDAGPEGTPVFLPKAAVPHPLKPCDDADDRRRIEHGGLTEAKPPWDLNHSPQTPARAGRVPGRCPLLRFALATAYRRQGERAALGGEPGGWQRWRRQLLEPHRDTVIVCAQGASGRVPLAVFARLMGATRQEVPPELGTRRDILAQYGLPPQG